MIHHQMCLRVPSLYPELGEGVCKFGGEVESMDTEFSRVTYPFIWGKRHTEVLIFDQDRRD